MYWCMDATMHGHVDWTSWCCTELLNTFLLDYFDSSITHKTKGLTCTIMWFIAILYSESCVWKSVKLIGKNKHGQLWMNLVRYAPVILSLFHGEKMSLVWIIPVSLCSWILYFLRKDEKDIGCHLSTVMEIGHGTVTESTTVPQRGEAIQKV